MIKLTNVTKVYKTGVRALNNMNLTIEPGEFVYAVSYTHLDVYKRQAPHTALRVVFK